MNERELRLWLAGQALQIAEIISSPRSIEDVTKELGITINQFSKNCTKNYAKILAKRAIEIADAIIEEEQNTYRSK